MSCEATTRKLRFCGGEPWALNIIVSVDINGAPAGVRLSGGALEMSDEQLGSQIVRLNTLAYLRWQLALPGVRDGPLQGRDGGSCADHRRARERDERVPVDADRSRPGPVGQQRPVVDRSADRVLAHPRHLRRLADRQRRRKVLDLGRCRPVFVFFIHSKTR